jgi:hypothetical protein
MAFLSMPKYGKPFRIEIEKIPRIGCLGAIHVLKINGPNHYHFTRRYVMGSFATSVHVKTNDAAAVADALRQLLSAEGYEATEEEPERGWPMSYPSPIRGIHVSVAREGWVSLLDSEGIGSQTLPASLSDQLQTHAIQFFVNDSDSWHYQLFHTGQVIDEFDSVPDEDDFEDDDESDDTPNLSAGINAADAQRIIQERVQQLQQQLLQNMPAHLRELQQKWRTTGQITREEMQEYNEWTRTQMPNLMEQIQELRNFKANQLASQAPPVNSSRLKQHLEHLRPILKENVKDSRLLEIMSKRETFAEHALGEFLPLVGIASYYANLSYQYLEETDTDELARNSIHLAEHLRFKRANGRGASHLKVYR